MVPLTFVAYYTVGDPAKNRHQRLQCLSNYTVFAQQGSLRNVAKCYYDIIMPQYIECMECLYEFCDDSRNNSPHNRKLPFISIFDGSY